ncbi:unnamed protein product [Cyprideis torosa]|uniref:Uncharacterized protein n=1 Tax=Cyprideis torosa TaxID=163714 RepID=A0A7R8W669_9CRUS|nr:unnamed protein product [Cyprideis torosa]CAG0886168.1 unnamed protein product [Cyprideis torosa]
MVAFAESEPVSHPLATDMSGLKIQQILENAKLLAGRLRDDDIHVDRLISQTQAVLESVDGMKEYQDELDEMNEVSHQRPRSVVAQGIQQEKRHIRELQHENRELQAALEETQNALDMVMTKYREQMSKLAKIRSLEKLPELQAHTESAESVRTKVEKISEMGAVMRSAIQMDEEDARKEQALVTQLLVENEGLRELLRISQKFGSVPPGNQVKGDNVTSTIKDESYTAGAGSVSLPPSCEGTSGSNSTKLSSLPVSTSVPAQAAESSPANPASSETVPSFSSVIQV